MAAEHSVLKCNILLPRLHIFSSGKVKFLGSLCPVGGEIVIRINDAVKGDVVVPVGGNFNRMLPYLFLLLVNIRTQRVCHCPSLKMALLHKFLCCCQLRNGAVVLGWLGLIVQLLSLSGFSVFIEQTKIYSSDLFEKMFLGYFLTLSVISIIAHSMLIWGATTKDKKFMLPWLVSTMVIIVSLFFYVVYLGAIVNILPGLVFVSGFTIIGIIFYMWLCILSFYQELSEGGEDSIPMTNILQEDTS